MFALAVEFPVEVIKGKWTSSLVDGRPLGRDQGPQKSCWERADAENLGAINERAKDPVALWFSWTATRTVLCKASGS